MDEEIVIHYLRNAQQQVCLYGRFFEHLEKMIGGTWYLLGKPLHCMSLFFQFLMNDIADMYLAFLHKKMTWNVFLA